MIRIQQEDKEHQRKNCWRCLNNLAAEGLLAAVRLAFKRL
tara:strand:+ start:293 stop:412 length:120 start_codon:yes stop_codon:yes gene_type:complete